MLAAAALALCIALLTASGWLGELIEGVSAVQRIPWARWTADAVTVLVCAACIARHEKLDGWLRNVGAREARRPQLVFLLLGVAAGLGRVLSCFSDVLGMPPLLAGVCHAVYEGSLMALLLAALCMTSAWATRWASLVFPAGFALAAVLHFVLRALPSVAVAAVAPSLPLVCAGVLAWVAATRAACERGDGDAISTEVAASCEDGVGDCTKWSFPVRPVMLMCTYAFAFNFSLSLSEGPNPYGMLGMLLVSLAAIAVAAALPSRYNANFLYKMALPLMVAGLVCLAFLGEGRTVAVLLPTRAMWPSASSYTSRLRCCAPAMP